MKPGDMVIFSKAGKDLGPYSASRLGDLRCALGLVIKKVRHVKDVWLVMRPPGSIEGYPESWLEVISESR